MCYNIRGSPMKASRDKPNSAGRGIPGILILCLLLAGCGHTGRDFRVHPYLLLTSPDELVLKFELEEDLPLSINRAPVEIYPAGRLHEISLGPQDCSRDLAVKVERVSAGERTTLFRQTAAARGCRPEDELSFAVISDTHGSRRSFARVEEFFSGRFAGQSPQWLLHLGDIVKQGCREERWLRLLGRESLARWPLVVAIGNHEYRGSPEDVRPAAVPTYFDRYLRWPGSPEAGYLSYDFPQLKLLVLNSNFFRLDRGQRERQLEWLEEELRQAEADGQPVVAAWHHAVLTSNRWKASSREIDFIEDRIVPRLEKYNVRLVLAGHTHIYERSYRNGIHYVNAGFWGYRGPPVVGNSNPYRRFAYSLRSTLVLVRVDRERIRVEAYNRRRELIDQLEVALP